jgi:hypothetical protein
MEFQFDASTGGRAIGGSRKTVLPDKLVTDPRPEDITLLQLIKECCQCTIGVES